MAEEIIFRVGVDTGDAENKVDGVTKSLEDTDKATKDLNKATTNLSSTFDEVYSDLKPLSARMGELEDRMYELALAGKQNSQEFLDLQKEAAKFRQTIINVDQAVDNLAMKGKSLQTALQLGETVVAGYGAVQGITALVGTENEELTETLVKLQGVQSLLAATEQIRLATEKNSLLSIKANTLAQQTYTVVVGQSTGAMKLFRLALAATGIGALIAVIAAVVMNWDKWTGSITRSSIATEGLNDTIDDYKQGAQDAAKSTNEVANAFELARAGVISKEEALATYNDQLGDTFGKATDLNEAERIFADKTDDYIKAASLRAQANALLEKAAEEQADALAASLEDQTTFTDKLSAVTGNLFSSTEEQYAALQKSQKKRVEDAKKTANQRAEIFNEEAQRLSKAAEQIDNANGIASEFDKKQAESAQKAAEDRQKRREAEAQRIKEENEKIAAEQRRLQREITDATIASIEDRETRERMALAEKHRRELEDIRLQYGEREELIRSLEERQYLESQALERSIMEQEQADLDAAKERRDARKLEEQDNERQHQETLGNILRIAAENQMAIDKALVESKRALVDNIASVFGALASISQENSARQKAFAIAEIAIQTATGFMDGLRLAQKAALETPTPVGKALVFTSFAATQFAAVLNTAKKVKGIIGAGASVSPPNATSGGGGSSISANPTGSNTTTDTTNLNNNQPQYIPVLAIQSLKQVEGQYDQAQQIATYP